MTIFLIKNRLKLSPDVISDRKKAPWWGCIWPWKVEKDPGLEVWAGVTFLASCSWANHFLKERVCARSCLLVFADLFGRSTEIDPAGAWLEMFEHFQCCSERLQFLPFQCRTDPRENWSESSGFYGACIPTPLLSRETFFGELWAVFKFERLLLSVKWKWWQFLCCIILGKNQPLWEISQTAKRMQNFLRALAIRYPTVILCNVE